MYAFYANEGELQAACHAVLSKFSYNEFFAYTYGNEMNFIVQVLDLPDVEKALLWIGTSFLCADIEENLATALRTTLERLGYSASGHRREIPGGFGIDVASRFIGCGQVHVICQWVR